MRWRHVGPRGQREGNITFFSFFFINPSSSSSPFLPHFVRLFVFQGNSFPLPVSLAVDGVHFIISHYFFVIMKDFFHGAVWGLGVPDGGTFHVWKWSLNSWIREFSSVGFFRLIFRSRGSEIVDEVLSCSVRFFLFFFFI